MFTFCHMSSPVLICRSEPILHMLTFTQKRGNATFYEWRTGNVPTVVERPVEEAPPDTLTEDAVGFTVYILSIINRNFLSLKYMFFTFFTTDKLLLNPSYFSYTTHFLIQIITVTKCI